MNDLPYNLKVIVLAAGKSTRFNGIKLIAKLKPQLHTSSLIEHVLQQVSTSLAMLKINKNNLQVATGDYHEQISDIIDNELVVNHCPDAQLGLGHTIAQSVRKIVKSNDGTSHIMITLADQVALTCDDYCKLIEQSKVTPDKLVCAKAQLEIMPPAVFPSRYFSKLMELTGDKGAKALLYKNKTQLQQVSLPNAAIDIDTREDLANWNKD